LTTNERIVWCGVLVVCITTTSFLVNARDKKDNNRVRDPFIVVERSYPVRTDITDEAYFKRNRDTPRAASARTDERSTQALERIAEALERIERKVD